MKIIVTGGNGKIGKAVVAKFVSLGHEVIILDRRPAERPGAKFIYTDLSRREMLQPIMEQADTIVHMGEIPNTRSGHNTEEEVFGRNCTVGSLIFQLASELKYKRVIYTSTIQVYGFMDMGSTPPVRLPVDESYPLTPQNPYSLAKVANESYARNMADKRGLSVAVFRLPWVLTHDVGDDWFHWSERKQKLDADLGIYVKDTDVAECFSLAVEKPRPGFEVYNLGAREVMYNEPIREALLRDRPDYPRLPENWGRYEMPYLWGKAKEHFGWKPKWNYLDIFREKFGREPNPK